MKTNYVIKSSTEGVVEKIDSTSTKRQVETNFNRLMRFFKKDPKYIVEPIRIGYSKVTYFSTFGHIETEYWIERV